MRAPETREHTQRMVVQPVLVLALVAVGIGNIAVPNSVPVVSGLYLPAALFILLLSVTLRSGRVLDALRFPFLLSALALAFAAGFLVAPLNAYGDAKLLSMGIALMLLVAPAAFRDLSSSLRWILVTLFVVSVVTSVLLLLIGQPDIAGRQTLLGLNPINTGRVAGVGVVIAAALVIGARSLLGRRTWLVALLAVPCMAATVATGSRGPVIAILLSIAALLAVAWLTSEHRTGLVLLGIGLLGGASLLLFDSGDQSSRLTSFDANGRDLLYQASFELIRDNPLGVGWGNFFHALPYFPRAGEDRLYSHNVFLEIGVEGGWAALAAFVALVIVALASSVRAASRGDRLAAIVVALLVFVIVNASLSSDIVGNRLMWLFLGLALLQAPLKAPQDGARGDGLFARAIPRTTP